MGFVFICIIGCSISNSQIADKYFEAGEYLKAVDEYTYVIAEDPNNFHAYLNRGKSYHELQKYNLVLIDYSIVINRRMLCYFQKIFLSRDTKIFLPLVLKDRCVA
jgi:tetratricopeptide (TPR) repeat protein|tara:strand:+ start:1003 stop:1317 length:315 start_codon:yes stop_codon:yes gene_type:complete